MRNSGLDRTIPLIFNIWLFSHLCGLLDKTCEGTEKRVFLYFSNNGIVHRIWFW